MLGADWIHRSWAVHQSGATPGSTHYPSRVVLRRADVAIRAGVPLLRPGPPRATRHPWWSAAPSGRPATRPPGPVSVDARIAPSPAAPGPFSPPADTRSSEIAPRALPGRRQCPRRAILLPIPVPGHSRARFAPSNRPNPLYPPVSVTPPTCATQSRPFATTRQPRPGAPGKQTGTVARRTSRTDTGPVKAKPWRAASPAVTGPPPVRPAVRTAHCWPGLRRKQ